MQVRHSKHPLPHDWSCLPGVEKALFQADAPVKEHGRLRAKLIVFRTKKDLHRFWKHGLGYSGWGEGLGRTCVGAVNALCHRHMAIVNGKSTQTWIEVDPRYFCVIGLCADWLSARVVTHECVHAGFAYAARTGHRNSWSPASDMAEEAICYPAGELAGWINQKLWEHKVYKDQK